jgi:hypothetical protein
LKIRKKYIRVFNKKEPNFQKPVYNNPEHKHTLKKNLKKTKKFKNVRLGTQLRKPVFWTLVDTQFLKYWIFKNVRHTSFEHGLSEVSQETAYECKTMHQPSCQTNRSIT